MTSQIPFTPLTPEALDRLTLDERLAFLAAAGAVAGDQKPSLEVVVTLVLTVQRLLTEAASPPATAALDREGLREIVRSAVANWSAGAPSERITDTLWPLLEHAQSAAAGSHEGIRLWMLDCGSLVQKHRERAEAAEAKLAAVRQYRVLVDEDDGDVVLSGPCAETTGCLFHRCFVSDDVTLGALIDAALEHEGPQGEQAHARIAEITGEPGRG